MYSVFIFMELYGHVSACFNRPINDVLNITDLDLLVYTIFILIPWALMVWFFNQN